MSSPRNVIQALRNGSILVSENFTLSPFSIGSDGIWICASEYMIDKLIPTISNAARQMVDVLDGKAIFKFESEREIFTKITFDFESKLSDFVMNFRAPLYLMVRNDFDASLLEIETNKLLPLPPELEGSCKSIYQGKLATVAFYKDGSFKIL